VVAALGFWAWLVLATLLVGAGADRLLKALAWGRIPIFLLALATWILAEPQARRWLMAGFAAAIGWVVVEVWLQLLVGRGLRGFRRWPTGELPGPFVRPRAGPFLAFGMWPPLLALAGPWLARPERAWRAAAWLILALALATLVFVGQRIPLVFGVFGLLIAAALLPALRLPALAALGAGAGALAISSVVAPAAFHRLVVQFSSQLAGFPDSHYGQILARALEMARQHPWLGLGESAFEAHCRDAAFHVGWVAGSDGGGAAICVTHAHNHYLQALTDAGWPGLLLFAAMALLLVLRLARGLLGSPRPLGVALFIGALLPLWPIASSYSFGTLPNLGLWLLMAGWGLAESTAKRA
jgi:O-antigen ligase